MRSAFAVLLTASMPAITACDALLVEPADPTGTTVSVTFDPTRAGARPGGTTIPGNWGVREIALALRRGQETRDTSVVGRYVDGRLRADVHLRAEEVTGQLEIAAEVRTSAGLPLFAGSGLLGNPTVLPTARVSLSPAPALAFIVGRSHNASRTGVSLSAFDGSQRVIFPAGRPHGIDISPVDGSVVYHNGRIILRDPYNGEKRFVTGLEPLGQELWPKFTHDGQWIYFESLSARAGSIWRIRPDGTDRELVLEAGSSAGPSLAVPALSHDGRSLLYASDRTPELRIWDMVADSSRWLGVHGTIRAGLPMTGGSPSWACRKPSASSARTGRATGRSRRFRSWTASGGRRTASGSSAQTRARRSRSASKSRRAWSRDGPCSERSPR